MLLLITDLDDTLVSQTASPMADRYLESFNTLWKAQFVAQQSLLVYNTGRSITLFYELFHRKNLLLPDFLICGVGTEMYRLTPDSKLERLQEWTDTISQDFQLESIKQWSSSWISSGLLRLQQETENTKVKLSFYFDPQQVEVVKTRIIPNLRASLVNPVNTVVSVQHEVGHLDILPVKANKGTAAMWLREYLHFPLELTVVRNFCCIFYYLVIDEKLCGDSMNDYDMFFSSTPPQVLRIAVGNCDESIRQQFLQVSSSHFYVASKPFAGGILEGLYHFGFWSGEQHVGWDSY